MSKLTHSNIEQISENWKKIVRPYMALDDKKAWLQVINTIVPFVALWYLAYQAYLTSFWLGFPISLLNAGFLIRLFIIMHDCGHGTLFKSTFSRNLVGHIAGWLHLTPYSQWSNDHAIHHNTSGNLDKKRKAGNNIWTITTQEYSQMPPLEKFNYRFQRHPVTMLLINPIVYYFILMRLYQPHDGSKEKRSVLYTNLFIAIVTPVLCLTIGWKAFLAVHLPTTFIAQMTGFYFFYVQHQYENAYWKRNEEWDYFEASMKGSSFFKLPKILQWFTASIGYHHIHHLCHLIPNYNLQKCHEENKLFQNPVELSLLDSLKCFNLHIYDESTKELISFREYKKRYPKGTVTKIPTFKMSKKIVS